MVDRASAIKAAIRSATRQDGALTTAQATDAGLTQSQIRALVGNGGWSRPFRGALLVPDAHPVRGPARAALLVRPGAVTCGPTAGWLYGIAPAAVAATPTAPVHLLVPPGTSRTRPTDDRLAVYWGPWRPEEFTEVLRFPATSPDRTLADLLLSHDRETAVGFVDAALHERLVIGTEGVARCLAGRPGALRARRWLTLADGRAESPLETRLRLLLVDAGVAPEELQWPVRRDGRVIARLDFAWPSRRVCVEADGVAYHNRQHSIARDRHRQNDLVALGWTFLRFTWSDVVRRPTEVVGAVAHALSRPAHQI